MTPRRLCVRINPYVDVEIAQKLEIHCAGSGATVSSVVEAALREHLDREGTFMSIMTRLDRIGRQLERTHRELELFLAAFGIWVKIWFAHNPRIRAEDLDLVRREAENRFAEFMDEVAEECANGRPFFDELRNAAQAKRAGDSDALAHESTAARGTNPSGEPHAQ